MVICQFIDILIDDLIHHKSLILLEKCVDLEHSCGYVTLLNTGAPVNNNNDSRNYNKGWY